MRAIRLRDHHLFLRITAAFMPPFDVFPLDREGVKWDALFANVAVDLLVATRVRIASASCGGAVGDEGLECREAAYYYG
jgi:hypothetical protein